MLHLCSVLSKVFSQTLDKRAVSWKGGRKAGKKDPTLSRLPAPLSQWIFHKLSPEVHKHRKWEKNCVSRRQEEWAGGPILRSWDVFLRWAWRELCCSWTYREVAALAAVNKTSPLSVFLCSELTLPSIWPHFMITINAWIACIKMWSGDEGLCFH